MQNSIDSKMLRIMFLAGTKNLESKQEWINELNVFPVPDGDTGTNMTMTLLTAVRDLKDADEEPLESVGKRIASGTLKGARGNSGVILSQLCRGFVKELKGVQEMDIPVFVNAFERAQLTAYKAVMKPKEGTILTVAKAISQKAAELAVQDTLTLNDFFTAVLAHAEKVLAETPDMLPVLKEAGVVDSGGQGLVEFLKGAYDAYTGKETDVEFEGDDKGMPFKPSAHISAGKQKKSDGYQAAREKKPDPEAVASAEIPYGYCTEFIVNIEKKFTARDEQAFKKYLSSIGDSLVCVCMDDLIKVHVHTNDPGLALQKGLSFGSLSGIKVDNMREEHNERLFGAEKQETEEAEEAEELQEEEPVEIIREEPEPVLETVVSSAPRKEYGFVAVCSGEGLKNVFLNMSVDEVIEGGQTMNPSTQDILDVVDKVNAEHIYVLPNNGNIIMAAQQAQQLCEDKQLIVIPTKTVAQGIAAVINYVPAMNIEENAQRMNEAIREIKTAEITYAVRDTSIEDRTITRGDFMGIGDNGLLAVGSDPEEVAAASVREMFDEDDEIVTIYYGADADEASARRVADQIEDEFDDAEVDVVYGGQPIYPYIVSVE